MLRQWRSASGRGGDLCRVRPCHDIGREARDRARVAAGQRARRHEAPPPQDAHVVRVVAHLVEVVRDDDHGAPGVGQAPQRRVEAGRLERREHGGRLIEDDDARVAHERPHDLEPLPIAHAERRDGRVPVDRHVHLTGDGRRARRGGHLAAAHRRRRGSARPRA